MLFMREEEKLARDVYLTLYDAWGLTPFASIAVSEQSHMNAMLLLLKYRLPDPAAGKPIGEFTDPDLQALYDTLIARGLGSARHLRPRTRHRAHRHVRTRRRGCRRRHSVRPAPQARCPERSRDRRRLYRPRSLDPRWS